jgi:hypothetical protein
MHLLGARELTSRPNLVETMTTGDSFDPGVRIGRLAAKKHLNPADSRFTADRLIRRMNAR